ncbi:hypothetical protein [Mycolicibacterium brisbanense]|uniref:Lipoprotein n=1 Tax=Mycolicibacterium brisbanense TaxID=146020 RepID=A0A100VZR8_9MYCO|nr:hypothetical protein [Mycolicibacterium brisbanense]MCV7160538.1 hypothetical protein [Mycolicibacterium brisbanense]GAS88993.1 uncharacterized protein RMCB_3089 [Mycolicibacterium brisbanense]
MRPSKIAALTAAALSLILPSCTTAQPALPDPSDPYQLRDRVASATGQQFLKDVTIFKWKDHGARVAHLFTWVPEWSTASVPTERQAAADTAYGIVTFLADTAPTLLKLDKANNGNVTVGDINPAIVESYTNAVIPFLGAMVGDPGNVAGFQPLDPLDSTMPRTFAAFTVLGTTATSSADLGAAIVNLTDHYREVLANSLAANPVDDNSISTQVARLAQLFGLAFASELKAPASSPYIFDPEVVRTELDYTLARATIVGPNEDVDRRYFDVGGKLLAPEYVRQHLGEAAWAEYSGMLSRYVARSNSLNGVDSKFSDQLSKTISSNRRR